MVHFAELRRFLVRLPSLGIALCRHFKLFKFWHDLAHCGEKRRQDETNEAGLTLGDLSRLTVAEERDRDALFLLDVPLVEKLLEQQDGPFDGHIEGTGLGRDVGSVDGEL